MITRQEGKIVPIPFDDLIDPVTGKTAVRMLDTSTEAFETAIRLQTRLEPNDLSETATAERIESATALDLETLRQRFG